MSGTRYILPAEWEPQECVQLTAPHEGTDWAPYLREINNTIAEIADAIARYERVIVVDDLERNDTWARDHGGITLLGPTRRILDFRFNGWGEKFVADKDNLLTRQLVADGRLTGELIDCDDFVLEGGSIESDGRGTIITTEQCLLAPHRNQPLTKQQIEDELRKRLCADRILWLHHGTLIGDDTDGHIDTIVRLAPNDTLLYVSCTDAADPHYADLQALEQELQALRTIDGQPYTLLPLPLPRAIYYDGERLPATYANFLIINGAVIVPTYAQPDLDQQACQQIQRAFPDREIIAIDARVIIRQHGSIHCLAMQYPAHPGTNT